MIIKRKIEQEVKICDSCKSAYDKDQDLPFCYICGKDVCYSCKQTLGQLSFCEEHYKWLFKQMKEKKKELTETPTQADSAESVS